METFTWKPAPGASLSEKPSVEVAKYGEGYEQRVGISINSQMDKWTVKFTTHVVAIRAFLKARNAVETFNWTNPLGVSGVYLCREWKVGHVGGDVFDLTGDFEEQPA